MHGYKNIGGNTLMEIKFVNGQFIIGKYSIAGNNEDGYTVWINDDGEDSDTIYNNQFLENCIVFCLTTL